MGVPLMVAESTLKSSKSHEQEHSSLAYAVDMLVRILRMYVLCSGTYFRYTPLCRNGIQSYMDRKLYLNKNESYKPHFLIKITIFKLHRIKTTRRPIRMSGPSYQGRDIEPASLFPSPERRSVGAWWCNSSPSHLILF
jgi:hypothetical protein